MAPAVEAAKENAWLRVTMSAVKEKVQSQMRSQQDAYGCVHPEKPGSVPEESRHWCGFEFAELMEEGHGPGLTSTYMEPPRDTSGQVRLCVQRSQNRSEYQLTTEKGQSLLVARCNADGTQYDFFVAHDSQPPRALGPAFTLKSNPAKNQWSLQSVRCEQCLSRGKRQCGVRELAHMTHYTEQVGDGQAFCVDVDLPPMHEDGSTSVFCATCSSDCWDQGTTMLTTRRPKWNAKHKSLTLDFGGRCTMASAKNFQLEAPEKPGKVKMLFGKVGANQFVLDFRHPLGPLQAFATALTASHWK